MKKQLIAAAVLAFASMGAYAQDITPSNKTSVQWTYVQAGAARTSLDDSDFSMDFDGWNIKGSAEIADEFHVFGQYQQANNDELNILGSTLDLDLEETELGFGWHPAIGDNMNAVVEISHVRQDVKATFMGFSASDDVNYWRVGGGIRGAFNDYVVGSLKGTYTDTSGQEGEFGAVAGLEVRFNRTWSIVGEADVTEHQNHYTVGVRASF